jgi:hypothetical protein
MRVITSWLAVLMVVLLTLPPRAHAQLYSHETRNVRLIYYSKGHEFVVPHIVGSFENALAFERKLFEYDPVEKVNVLLQDFGDYASGSANTVPFNLMNIGIAPFSYVYETMPAEERMHLMMMHELVHVITMDKPSPGDNFFRSLFAGKVVPIAEEPVSMLYAYATGPRWYAPRWFVEAIAVYLETWMAGGLGRALGAYDEMIFRTLMRDSAYVYDVVGLEAEGTKVDFNVGAASYLYGTRFVSYLALQYGPDKVIEWYKQTPESRAYFSSQFEKVYGRPLGEEWERWIAWERSWQQANLDSIRRYPVTEFRRIAPRAMGSVSRAYIDSSRHAAYVAVNYPGQYPHLASIDLEGGEVRSLANVRGGALFYVTSLAYDPESRTLFYTTDNNHWRDLFAYDIDGGESRRILADGRTGDLAFNRADRSLWGVRHFNGISTLVRIPFPYTEWNQVISFDYGKDLFDIDISPDGRELVGAMTDVDGTQRLMHLHTADLLAGRLAPDTLYDFANSTPSNFVFSSDGTTLLGSSFYSGVSNIVKYDFPSRTMSWLTNGETGFFRPVAVSADSLFAFHFTSRGFEPAMLAARRVEDVSAIRYLGQAVVESHPELQKYALPPPSAVNVDSVTTYRGDYSPMANIRLASIYPVVQGYKAYPAYGLRFNLSEPLFLHRINLTASYTPNARLPMNERLHAALDYNFWEWGISGTWNSADFYDLFGPVKHSRKGSSVRITYRSYWTFKEPETLEFNTFLGGFWGLERLPDYQNVSVSYDKFYSLNATLRYSLLTRSLGATEEEQGLQWELGSLNDEVQGTLYPKVYASAAIGTLLPIDHSSVWLRGSAGYAHGDQLEPVANFYFGGFGNNWVDHREYRRYRNYEAFPGAGLNSIGGTNFGKIMGEWVLPPVRFRRLGGEVLYCNWAQMALFSGAIVTDFHDASARRTVGNAGAQMDFRLVLFSVLESTLSFGYAAAVEKHQRRTEEFMVSLKILK